jgi:ribosomal protein S27AE
VNGDQKHDELEQRLEVELDCPECGASFVATVWDRSFRCTYCGSLLACERALGEEVFAASDGKATADDVLGLIVRNETEGYRNELLGRARGEDGETHVLLPAVLEAQVAAFKADLERKLSLVLAGDFLVPYELHERTVFQGILGRRNGGAKESLVESQKSEDVARRYDPSAFNLRDRGLKLRGSRLALLRDGHLTRCGGRALAASQSPAPQAALADRVHLAADPGLEVISRLDAVTGERRLRVWKHMGFARIQRGAETENVLVDRQFGTVAGTLEPEELEALHALEPRPLDEVLQKPVLHAIAAECPNCGNPVALSPRAKIAFCATCGVAIGVAPDGLSEVRALHAAPTAADGASEVVGFPFWAFPARVRAGGAEFTRFWDWLERVSPQPAAVRYRENDPAEAKLFVPARALYGARELDDAFAALAAVATWRQPTLSPDRPTPGDRLKLLDVELGADEAAALARFALVALHDRQSTRALTGLSFKSLVVGAELTLGTAELVVVGLALHGDAWLPAGRAATTDLRAAPVFPPPVPRGVLEDAGQIPRRSRAFSLA